MSKMKFLFVGDLHGDLECAEQMIDLAKKEQCDEIIQVGDWGFLWPGEVNNVKTLSDMLARSRMMMRFCDGNHDWHPELRKFARNTEHNVADYLTYQHRGTMKEYPSGPRFVFLGGAPSIDREGRRPGFSWWPEEYITEEDVEAALEYALKVDVLVTHDTGTPIPGFKEAQSMSFNYRARESHSSLRRVLKGLRPALNIHGHYHHRYEAQDANGCTKVIGLGSNINTYQDLYFVYEH